MVSLNLFTYQGSLNVITGNVQWYRMNKNILEIRFIVSFFFLFFFKYVSFVCLYLFLYLFAVVLVAADY